MTTATGTIRQAVRPLARLGYGARGVVYLVIAFFALMAAIGGRETEDTRGAIEWLSGSVAGGVLTLVLVVGLAGYSLWRFIQSLFDTDDHGWSAKGLAVRGGLLASAVTHAVLTVYTWSLWRGATSNGDGGGGSGDAAGVLAGLVGARPIAFALAAVFAGVAIAHLAKAVRQGYRKHIDAPPDIMPAIDPVAMVGLTARGAVFAILAILLATRGLHGSGEGTEPPGLADALDYVLGLAFGTWLLAAMALGLAAFACYSLVEAAWRRINVEDA